MIPIHISSRLEWNILFPVFSSMGFVRYWKFSSIFSENCLFSSIFSSIWACSSISSIFQYIPVSLATMELNTDTNTTIQTSNSGILVKYHDILPAGGEHFLGIMFLTIKWAGENFSETQNFMKSKSQKSHMKKYRMRKCHPPPFFFRSPHLFG